MGWINIISEIDGIDKGFSADFLGGATGDEASVVVDVKVIKSEDSAVISHFTASRKSKIETTDQVLMKAVELIVEYMEGH